MKGFWYWGTLFCHLGICSGYGFASVESAHFEVFTSNESTARELTPLLERAFTIDNHSWFPGENAPPWTSKCRVNAYDTVAEFEAATGQSRRAPAFTTIEWAGSEVRARTLSLRLDYAEARTGVIPHEVFHAIDTDRFGVSRYLPHWADEGMAVLGEPEYRIQTVLGALAQGEAGEYQTAAYVLAGNDYPATEKLRGFYSGSVGLTRYLAEELGTHADFVRFLRSAMDGDSIGYEAPLQDVYHLTLSQLESGFAEFQARLRNTFLPTVYPVSWPRREEETFPAPPLQLF